MPFVCHNACSVLIGFARFLIAAVLLRDCRMMTVTIRLSIYLDTFERSSESKCPQRMCVCVCVQFSYYVIKFNAYSSCTSKHPRSVLNVLQRPTSTTRVHSVYVWFLSPLLYCTSRFVRNHLFFATPSSSAVPARDNDICHNFCQFKWKQQRDADE